MESGVNFVFRVVMPCGGALKDVSASLESVNSVAVCIPNSRFIVYRTFNNGLKPPIGREPSYDRLEIQDFDINPERSAALARNRVLDEISKLSGETIGHFKDYTVFLDSGDLLLPDLITQVVSGEFQGHDVIVGSAVIKAQDHSYERIRVPLLFRHIMNPIYLGSALVRTSIVISERFVIGRKEDWKFWLAILNQNPMLCHSNSKNYIYSIRDRRNHMMRKGRLVRHQFHFYRYHLRFGLVKSLLMLLLHYFGVLIVWWVIMPIKLSVKINGIKRKSK
jgi:hypothetical protein